MTFRELAALALRPWHAWTRLIDTKLLWPSVRGMGRERGMTLEQSREGFMLLAGVDRAWTSLGEDEMRRRVGGLT